MTRSLTVAALALAVVCAVSAGPPALAQGCSMCSSSLGSEHDPLARGMASSIYFMLSMPFALFFAVAGWLVWRHRRRARPEPPPAAHRPIASGVTLEENPS